METFEAYRPLMFAIAYRMLGSVMEAEDIVQDAFLRYQAVAADVESPKAFLSTIVTRLCLDQLKSAKSQRETYIGPWLPEPLITPQTPFDNHYDSISMAFLVLLENLTPVERAVFLLREVFDYSYGEIAQVVDKEEAACRQILHRAKVHIAAHRPRFEASPEEHHHLLQRFLEAITVGDVENLTALLATDATLWTDGGGKASAALYPLHGADTIVKFIMGLRRISSDFSLEIHEINGRDALLIRDRTTASLTLMTMETDGGVIHSFRVIRNPDKLRAFDEE